jgi:transcriptional/translational regulatory protein YebC/TACO1
MVRRSKSAVYEGYAAGGVSVLVEAATDNRSRTASEVRAAFSKNGGKLGEPGSVQWLFEQKGIIEIDAAGRSVDEVQLVAIDAGAEDVEVDGLAHHGLYDPDRLRAREEGHRSRRHPHQLGRDQHAADE